jgi:acetoin utilization deacetylase AcuC-like enzyme
MFEETVTQASSRIIELLRDKQRVICIDIDVHRGDSVEESGD